MRRTALTVVALFLLAACGDSGYTQEELDAATAIGERSAGADLLARDIEVETLRAQVEALQGEAVSAGDLEATVAEQQEDIDRLVQEKSRLVREKGALSTQVRELELQVATTTTTEPPTTTTTAAPEPGTEPLSSGVYKVGVDIAPGGWQAPPDLQNCYWERTDDQGEIIDNHFGSTGAGLIVTVEATDYSVEFNGCGEMTYLGP